MLFAPGTKQQIIFRRPVYLCKSTKYKWQEWKIWTVIDHTYKASKYIQPWTNKFESDKTMWLFVTKSQEKKHYKHTAKMTKLSGQLKDLVWQVVTIWLESLEDGRPLKRVPSRGQSCWNIFSQFWIFSSTTTFTKTDSCRNCRNDDMITMLTWTPQCLRGAKPEELLDAEWEEEEGL